MNIGLTYDLRAEYLALGWSELDTAEFDRPDTIDELEGAIRAHGHDVDRVGNAARLIQRLSEGDRWDLVFNIAEGTHGPGREALVPALLEAWEIPCTFGDSLCCCATLDKPTTKRVLRDLGLPTPDFAVVERLADLDSVHLEPPLFAKPAREGTSKGIGPDAVVRSRAALRDLCARLLEQFRQPVLIERYLPGREVTVGIVGTGPRAEVVGVLEVAEREGSGAEPGAYTYENKERCEDLVDYRLVRGKIADDTGPLGLAAYRAMGCRDAGRVDLRCDEDGRFLLLEVNPLSGMHPKHSDLPIMAEQAGWTYVELIGRIIESAAERVADARRTAHTRRAIPVA